MTPIVYISVSDDRRRLIIDGHLIAIRVADRSPRKRNRAASTHSHSSRVKVENEQTIAAQGSQERVGDGSNS
jgi:hypothetical protein